MLLQTNSYIVPKERRAEHARLLRRFRQVLARLGCDSFEVYEQVGQNWNADQASGRFVQIMKFRDRRQQLAVQAAEQNDPAAQAIIAEFCDLINFPYQQQHGYFAVGFYTSILPLGPTRSESSQAEGSHSAQEASADPNAPAPSEAALPHQPFAQVGGLAFEEETPAPHEQPDGRPQAEAVETPTSPYPRAAQEEPAATESGTALDEAESAEVDAHYLQEDPQEQVQEFGSSPTEPTEKFEPAEPAHDLPQAPGGADDFDSLLEQHFGGENGDQPTDRPAEGEGIESGAGDPEIGKVLDAGLLGDPDLDVAMPAELIDDSEEDLDPHAGDPHRLGGRFEGGSNRG